jgi:hypothetical protein
MEEYDQNHGSTSWPNDNKRCWDTLNEYIDCRQPPVDNKRTCTKWSPSLATKPNSAMSLSFLCSPESSEGIVYNPVTENNNPHDILGAFGPHVLHDPQASDKSSGGSSPGDMEHSSLQSRRTLDAFGIRSVDLALDSEDISISMPWVQGKYESKQLGKLNLQIWNLRTIIIDVSQELRAPAKSIRP